MNPIANGMNAIVFVGNQLLRPESDGQRHGDEGNAAENDIYESSVPVG
jgi:hypothetical protein